MDVTCSQQERRGSAGFRLVLIRILLAGATPLNEVPQYSHLGHINIGQIQQHVHKCTCINNYTVTLYGGFISSNLSSRSEIAPPPCCITLPPVAPKEELSRRALSVQWFSAPFLRTYPTRHFCASLASTYCASPLTTTPPPFERKNHLRQSKY